MATSPDPFTATNVTAPVNGAAAIAATVQPADNTTTVVVYNEDAATTLLVAIATAPVVAAVAKATSVHVPAASSITLNIGDVGNRGVFGTGAGEKTLYYSADSAGATCVGRITYVNGFGA
jgi:hypothetical protein